MEQGEATPSKVRNLRGLARTIQRVTLCAIPVVGSLYVMDVHTSFGLAILREQYLGLFLSLVLIAVFLGTAPAPSSRRDKVPWYDIVLCALTTAIGAYIAILYPWLLYDMAYVTPDKWISGLLGIILVLEAVRRLMGSILVVLGLAFVLYGHWAHLFPGFLQGKGSPWGRMVPYLVLDSNGMLGLPLAVGGTMVLGFIFFGHALFAVGGGTLLNQVALATMGRFRGGPAKVAVVASGLFGMISGSAAANVATTGVVTIPLMKRTGYRPHVAGAVEAVASTGGQIMPPVMGAAAFLIAEVLAISYADVVVAAFFPAFLYYLAVFVQVDLEAGKYGLRGMPREELPRVWPVLRTGWMFIPPILILIYTLLLANVEAGKAALLSAGSAIGFGMLSRDMRAQFRRPGAWVKLLEGGGRAMLELGAVTALAGMIVGVFSLTGLGFNLAFNLVKAAGGNVFFLLLLTACVAMVLGMGMPTVPVYIILAVLVAPALVQLDIEPLAAHLFIFYFGILSMITPPVCFAVYVGAAIANAEPMRTGYEAMRLALIAYVVPFVFVFGPSLLLKGSTVFVILAMVTAVLGVLFMGIGLVGYHLEPIGRLKRLAFILGAVGLLIPLDARIPYSWTVNILGLIMTLPILLWDVLGRGWRPEAAGAPDQMRLR